MPCSVPRLMGGPRGRCRTAPRARRRHRDARRVRRRARPASAAGPPTSCTSATHDRSGREAVAGCGSAADHQPRRRTLDPLVAEGQPHRRPRPGVAARLVRRGDERAPGRPGRRRGGVRRALGVERGEHDVEQRHDQQDRQPDELDQRRARLASARGVLTAPSPARRGRSPTARRRDPTAPAAVRRPAPCTTTVGTPSTVSPRARHVAARTGPRRRHGSAGASAQRRRPGPRSMFAP